MPLIFLVILMILVASNDWGSNFDSLNIALDDPMLNRVYDFTDRMILKYDFQSFHKNHRPYTRDQLLSFLKHLENKDLSHTEQQQAQNYIYHFSNWDAILGYRTGISQFNLNVESGLFFTRRVALTNSNEGNEYIWQIRPIVNGQIADNFVFSTDLRFFLITGKNLEDTVRTEVEVSQINELAFDTAGLAPSYLKIRLPWFDLLAGKQNLCWGPGRNGNLLLSAYAMPMEMIQMQGNYGKVAFQAFHAIAQSTLGNKILSGHRVNLQPIPRFRLGISEIVVIGADNFDPRFLNPFTIYTISEPSGGGHYAPNGKTSQGNLFLMEFGNIWFSIILEVCVRLLSC